ncbi:MAG: efflux RND transporter periplasmic adaptor subunit [Gammaproteobacteria bacterium]|nr:efflux RND transporter periplasmic adaptor subunit [Gammaproteobacteria bacterium]
MIHTIFRHSVLLIVSLLLTACSDDTDVTETPLRSVRTMIIHSAANGDQRTFSGIAKSTQEAQLSFKVSGTLDRLPVEVGDQLKPGQLIASLDSSQFQLEVQQSQATLAQARATLRNAQANYDRVKRLYENNNASRNDLDTARSAAESAQAQVKASEKAVQITRLKLSYTRLNANKTCQVADVPVSNNENVSSGQSIVMVTCGDDLEIELSVAETYIAWMKRGMHAQVSFSVLPGQHFDGVVTEVGVASTAGGSTFPVTVQLSERSAQMRNGQLRSGLAAEVTFEFSADSAAHSDRILVPPVAVGEDSAGRYVYVLEATPDSKQGVVRRREVSVGQLNADGLEVVSGLHRGEHLITAGVTVIYDGLQVLVTP